MAKYEYWISPDGLLKLGAWARDGLTDEQISKNMGIARKTLYEWKKQFSDICDVLKRGKEIADIEVENALYKRAVGYTTVEKRTETSLKDSKTVTITKEVPPDVTAAIFWLKNRKPETWRDKGEIRATSDDAIINKLKEVFGNAK